MDINQIIFTRTAPANKVEIVESLTQAELLNILPATIARMVKEAGTRLYKSRDKELRISYERRTGNNWNSTIDGVRNYKGNPMLDLYIQYENTDTSASVSLSDFLCKGDYRGSIVRDDRCGNPRSYYFTYTVADKARFVRQLLLEYLNRKYKDKL
ncbi:MAG: hypothetical protein J6C31_05650 [Prevotella sp.]|nr:hypothetical protein [Prevotella sp.]